MESPGNGFPCPSGLAACPNSDPNFNKIIGDRTPSERSALYVLCVLVRFTLYSGVYVYRDEPWMRWVVALLSVLSVFQLTKPTQNCQWWSKKFQLVMAVLVLLSAAFVKNTKAMPTLLFISLLGGVLQRLHVTMC